MAIMMAPRPTSTSQEATLHTSPRPAKRGRPKTKANAIPAAAKAVSGTSTSTNIRRSSVAGKHAAIAPQIAPVVDSTTSTAFTTPNNIPLETAPIGTSVTTGAMNLNTSIKPKTQHAQSQGQASVQQQQHQADGPPPAAQQQLQHPRSSSIVHQHHPGSPIQQRQQFNHASQAQGDGDVTALQQQHFLTSPVNSEPGQPNQALHYLQEQYPQEPGPFPVTEDGRVLMATAQMQRSYPNIYNTPQSHSPSVSSPHDVQNRALFAQPHAAHMGSSMYGSYPSYHQSMSQVQQPTYAHPSHSQAPQNMSTQSLLMSHQGQSTPQMQHQAHTQSPSTISQQSPRPKLEPSAMPLHRSMDSATVHQSPQQRLSASAQGPPSSSGTLQQSPRSGSGTSNAAPGPIPATTPVLIREDQDGAQWISFEYSRDRVKMEYTIKCNVETVDPATLDPKFKDDNCVYPRAMTTKEEYKGNRYGYETECNNVGWALASLNPCIRGKRGLIQRAVDSWRNSNSDQKLRSRRVRRQQKIKNRKNSEATQQPPVGALGGAGMQRPPSMPSNVPNMGVEASYHQHQVPGSAADDGTNAGFPPSHIRGGSIASVFPGSQAYPSQLSSAGSMPPPVYDQMDPRASFSSSTGGPIPASQRHSRNDTMSTVGSPMLTSPTEPSASTIDRKRKRSDSDDGTSAPLPVELYGDVRDSKRPKFILVEDAARNQARVRVRVTLDQVNLDDVPDSYRQKLSVYPRAYFPMQFRETPAEMRARTGGRWVEDGSNEVNPTSMGAKKADGDGELRALARKTVVKIGNLNGGEIGEETVGAGDSEQMEVEATGGPREHGRRATIGSVSSAGGSGLAAHAPTGYEVSVPGLTVSKRKREEILNELGVRMAWSQSRVFAGRVLFLQKSLDAFRNKMRTTIMNSSSNSEGDDTTGTSTTNVPPTVNPHFETRVGKRRWLAGRKKTNSKASDEDSDTERR